MYIFAAFLSTRELQIIIDINKSIFLHGLLDCVMEFEDVLKKVGSYGKYQKHLLFGFLIPLVMILPSTIFINLFFLSIPEHWCDVPELELLNLTTKQEQELNSLGIRTSCFALDVNYSNILSAEGVWILPENATSKKCADGWHYDQTNYDFTAATQWNMVCDKSNYPSFVLTMCNIGSIVGAPFYGQLSDRYGRKPTIFIMAFVFFATTITSVFITNFTAFVVLRAISYSVMPVIYITPIVLFLEIVDPDMRARVNGIYCIFWTAGMCILPFIAWLSRDWITLGIIASLMVGAILLYWPIVPESPCWLLVRGKHDEATEVMMRIAKKNGNIFDSMEISTLLEVNKFHKGVKNKKDFECNLTSPLSLLKLPELRKKFLIITYGWLANYAAYYGLQINGYNLVGSEFLNFFLLGVAELPGYFGGWLFMDKIGRKWCNVSALTLTGLACLVPVVYKNDTASVVAAFIGKLGSSAAYIATYQHGSELYPTPVRAIGLSLSATTASIIGMGLPYIVYLNQYGEFIPFLTVAVLTLTAAFAMSFLPETLNQNLPQTMADAENLGLVQNYFPYNRHRTSATRTSTAISENNLELLQN